METYELGEKDGHRFIRCLFCRLESYHPVDIERRYCGHCHRFHGAGQGGRIWITQWLCPDRHASIALMWDPRATTARAIEDQGEAIYRSGAVGRYCGICGRGLTLEHAPTRYVTMHEAEIAGRAVEAANLATREHFDKSKN